MTKNKCQRGMMGEKETIFLADSSNIPYLFTQNNCCSIVDYVCLHTLDIQCEHEVPPLPLKPPLYFLPHFHNIYHISHRELRGLLIAIEIWRRNNFSFCHEQQSKSEMFYQQNRYLDFSSALLWFHWFVGNIFSWFVCDLRRRIQLST